MKAVEMIVTLKVPDNTAITALQTLKSLGYAEIGDLKRADYYKFTVTSDLENFKSKISKVDLIVNANKHSYDFSLPKGVTKILVKNIDDAAESLLLILKNRLGLKGIAKIERGILWILSIEGKNPGKIAEKAAKELLSNEHYQEFSIL